MAPEARTALATRWLVLGALLAIAACGRVDTASRLPSRADCIVGARLIWPQGTSESNANAIVARMSREITRNQRAHIAGVQNQDNREIYVIYSDDCQSRQSKFDSLVRQLQLAVYQAPEFDIIAGTIEPGPDTIDVYGPRWRDGQRPGDE